MHARWDQVNQISGGNLVTGLQTTIGQLILMCEGQCLWVSSMNIFFIYTIFFLLLVCVALK